MPVLAFWLLVKGYAKLSLCNKSHPHLWYNLNDDTWQTVIRIVVFNEYQQIHFPVPINDCSPVLTGPTAAVIGVEEIQGDRETGQI